MPLDAWEISWGDSWGESWGDVTPQDAWGDSWGNAWGDSWGHTVTATPTTIPEGRHAGAGGGGDGKATRRRLRWGHPQPELLGQFPSVISARANVRIRGEAQLRAGLLARVRTLAATISASARLALDVMPAWFHRPEPLAILSLEAAIALRGRARFISKRKQREIEDAALTGVP